MLSFAISAYALPTVLLIALTFVITTLYYKESHKKKTEEFAGGRMLAGPERHFDTAEIQTMTAGMMTTC